MDVAIGLPSMIPGTTRQQLVEWARRADAAGFSSLGTLDRVVYQNFEPLVALSVAAAVTERIRLSTDILLLPLRENAVAVAKQAASLNELSGNRLSLGVGPGGRDDDFEVAGIAMSDRGERMTEMLARMREVWDDPRIGPDSTPELIVGGAVEASFERAARYGDGWTAGGSPPEQVKAGREAVEEAWQKAGREGKPRIWALAYFGLGPDAEEHARKDLLHYYTWLGDYAQAIADSAATDEQTVSAYLAAYEEAGADQLFLFPTNPDPAQVDMLAEVALTQDERA
jgi:alkanesulfonate monooxygenase SsuD/methylene tetrahydromethanopterin reductase-like flavin-dependent oxidoreductase (luciferase family)